MLFGTEIVLSKYVVFFITPNYVVAEDLHNLTIGYKR